jgi:HD-like signal output (HDOD) protein
LTIEAADQALRQAAILLNGAPAMLERLMGQDLAEATLDALASGLVGEPSNRANTLRAAIEERGADAVREAALVLTFRGLCSEAGRAWPAFGIGAFRSGVAAAHAMRQFGFRCSLDPLSAFASGLFHEAGMIVLGLARGKEYQRLLTALGGEQREVHDAEQQTFGVDHRLVAKAALDDKGFPAPVIAAAADHHRPLFEATPASETMATVALVVRQLGYSFGAANVPPDFAAEESDLLARMPGGIEKLSANVVAAVEAADRVWIHSTR